MMVLYAMLTLGSIFADGKYNRAVGRFSGLAIEGSSVTLGRLSLGVAQTRLWLHRVDLDATKKKRCCRYAPCSQSAKRAHIVLDCRMSLFIITI
jgi:hypothetical protein